MLAYTAYSVYSAYSAYNQWILYLFIMETHKIWKVEWLWRLLQYWLLHTGRPSLRIWIDISWVIIFLWKFFIVAWKLVPCQPKLCYNGNNMKNVQICRICQICRIRRICLIYEIWQICQICKSQFRYEPPLLIWQIWTHPFSYDQYVMICKIIWPIWTPPFYIHFFLKICKI